MNVYDFDETIYRNDSTADLVKYCFVHHPKTLLSVPGTIWYALLWALHIVDKQTFKEHMYRFLTYLKDPEKVVEEFVSANLHKIEKYYLARQKEDDLVISASPYFLISAFCKRIGIKRVMASPVNIHTGKYEGLNCHGEEKVRRYLEVYKADEVDEFYSDSYSDTPRAKLAKKAFLVKKGVVLPWGR